MKHKILSVITGTLSLLALSVAGAYAGDVCCASGTVTAAGGGYYDEVKGKVIAGKHSVTFECADSALSGTFAAAGSLGDRILATALTAFVEEGTVTYCVTANSDGSVKTGSGSKITLLHIIPMPET